MPIQKLNLTPQVFNGDRSWLHETAFDRRYKELYIERAGIFASIWNRFLLWTFGTRYAGCLTANAAQRPAELAAIKKYENALNDVVHQLAWTPIVNKSEADFLGVEAAASTAKNMKARDALNEKIKAFYTALDERITQLGPDTLDRTAALYQTGLLELTKKVEEHNKKWFRWGINENRVTYIQNEKIAQGAAIDRIIEHITPQAIVKKGPAALTDELDLYARVFGNQLKPNRLKAKILETIADEPTLEEKRRALKAALDDQYAPRNINALQEKERNALLAKLEDTRGLLQYRADLATALENQQKRDQSEANAKSKEIDSTLESITSILYGLAIVDYDPEDIFTSREIFELSPQQQLQEILQLEKRVGQDVALSPCIARAKSALTAYMDLIKEIDNLPGKIAAHYKKQLELLNEIEKLEADIKNVSHNVRGPDQDIVSTLRLFIPSEESNDVSSLSHRKPGEPNSPRHAVFEQPESIDDSEEINAISPTLKKLKEPLFLITPMPDDQIEIIPMPVNQDSQPITPKTPESHSPKRPAPITIERNIPSIDEHSGLITPDESLEASQNTSPTHDHFDGGYKPTGNYYADFASVRY